MEHWNNTDNNDDVDDNDLLNQVQAAYGLAQTISETIMTRKGKIAHRVAPPPRSLRPDVQAAQRNLRAAEEA
jgi:hypothetical protein